jgi:adenylate cyclase
MQLIAGMFDTLRELRRRRVFRLAGIYVVAAWLVLQIADVTFGPLGLPPWAMTALIWIIIGGFFLALTLGWRYDITSEGIVRITPSLEAQEEILELTRFDHVLIVASIVAVGLLAWGLTGHIAEQTGIDMGPYVRPAQAVAVLPFANYTGDESLGYLGDGVAEEVINHLAQLPGLPVLARNVTFRYRDAATDPREIARELDVSHIVSGSVRRSGEQLRITAQLVDADSGLQMWSRSESSSRLDSFRVQDAISTGVALAVLAEMGLEDVDVSAVASRPPHPEAYDLYLRGRYVWHQRGAEPVEKAVDLLTEAVRVDPDFAAGWSALASAYLTWPSYSEDRGDEWHLAEEAARKALALDARLPEAHTVLATFAESARDWIGATGHFEEALRHGATDATVRYWYSEHLAKVGRYAEGVGQLSVARDLDPIYVPPRVDSIFALLMYGRSVPALQEFEKLWAQGSRSPVLWQAGFIGYLLAGDLARARMLVEDSPMPPGHKQTIFQFVAVQAREADRDALIASIEDGSRELPDYRLLVWLLARIEAHDLAIRILQDRIEQALWIEPRVLWGPGHRLMEADGFTEIIGQLGFVEYWQAVGWGDFCRVESARLKCTPEQGDEPPEALEQLAQSVE